jgi:parallel beta-helix repeat protein
MPARARTPRRLLPVTVLLTALLTALVASATLTPSRASAVTGTAGSAAVGSTSYPVPSGAVFAAPGSGAGNGTASSPYRGAQNAINKAASGSTIVLRGGTYRESITIPFGKKLTLQPYPGEAVWFDGSGPVTGWVKTGSTWTVSSWTYVFDKRVSFDPNADETARWTQASAPYAGYPDQLWINGSEQKQVGSASAVTPGTFYVDRTNKKLVIGSDPTGRTVEASKLVKAIKIQGAGSTIRGIGVRRYANNVATMGAVSAEVDNLTLENVVIKDNATIGFTVWGDNATLRNVSLTGNGLLGLHGNQADGLQVLSSDIESNNDQNFKEAPVSGGVKISRSKNVRFADSTISHNVTSGLWFDISSQSVKIVRNRITDNGASGLEYELSARGIIADNYIARNGDAGLFLYDSNDVQVWNNTFDRNKRTWQVLQDSRRQPDSSLASSVPWVTSDIDVSNNVFVYGTDNCPLLPLDQQGKWSGSQFDIASNGNVYHRASASSPSRFACWPNGSSTKSFTTLSAFTSGTGEDARSKGYDGTGILTSTGDLTSSVRSATSAVPLGLPSDVAAAVGRSAGEKSVGAFLVR